LLPRDLDRVCTYWRAGPFDRLRRLETTTLAASASKARAKAWLAFFIEFVLQRMLADLFEPAATKRGSAMTTDYQRRLADAVMPTAGMALGIVAPITTMASHRFVRKSKSAKSMRCPSWACYQSAPKDRAEWPLRAAERTLVLPGVDMIRLLTPPFNSTPNDPGYYQQATFQGIRENGGQYTHGVLCLVSSSCEMGRGTQAVDS